MYQTQFNFPNKPIEVLPMNYNSSAWPFPRFHPNESYTPANKAKIEASINNANRVMQALERTELLEQAEEEGVGIVHVYSPEFPKGGLTCAFRKCTEYDGDVMVEVAVNVCSDKDSFSKKLGARGALTKFFDGETICLPLLRGHNAEDLNFVVKNAFTMMYFLD